jgi:hypothetical protein
MGTRGHGTGSRIVIPFSTRFIAPLVLHSFSYGLAHTQCLPSRQGRLSHFHVGLYSSWVRRRCSCFSWAFITPGTSSRTTSS